MSEELRELYQRVIIDHNRSPRNYGHVENSTHRAEGYNPICGDRIELSLRINEDIVEAIGFESASCAICQASASLMTVAFEGKHLLNIEAITQAVSGILSREASVANDLGPEDPLRALSGVRQFPARIKCAQLPWETYCAALKK